MQNLEINIAQTTDMSFFQPLNNTELFDNAILLEDSGSTCITYRVRVDGKTQFLKKLKPELEGNPRFTSLFTKEFYVGQQLSHPNLVRYNRLEIESKEGSFMLMDYVDGQTLEDYLKDQPEFFRNKANLKKFISQLLDVLHYLHSRQILHLDLTPTNIMLTRVNHDLKLLDLGYCYTDSFNTSIGKTDEYAAPEQMGNSILDIDVRTDLYAVGRMLQEIERSIGTSLPKTYRELMLLCLQEQIGKRPETAMDCIRLIQKEKSGNSWKGVLITGVILLVLIGTAFSIKSVRESIGFVVENFHLNDYDMAYRGVYYRILSKEESTCEAIGLEMGKDSLFIGTNVNIPSVVNYLGKAYRVISLGDLAISRQTEVPSVQLPNGLENIGEEAFWNDLSLTSISIPNTVETIGNSAFRSCENLVNIKLSDKLREIPSQAFQNCFMLNNVVIPEGVVSIGMDAFINCQKLEHITLPSTLERIDRGAFYLCGNLKEISLPANLKDMGDFIFHHCTQLSDVYNYSLVPQTITDIFDKKCHITLHVPAESVELYQKAPIWNNCVVVGIE